MHCFNLTAPYTVLTKLVALRLECVHYPLNWAEEGVYLALSELGSSCPIRRHVPTNIHVPSFPVYFPNQTQTGAVTAPSIQQKTLAVAALNQLK